jgi:hypothetical protein
MFVQSVVVKKLQMGICWTTSSKSQGIRDFQSRSHFAHVSVAFISILELFAKKAFFHK